MFFQNKAQITNLRQREFGGGETGFYSRIIVIFKEKNPMFFEKYTLHKKAKIRESLLWEYDLVKIDWLQMRNVIVQRVIERGRTDDFYAILNRYGLSGVKEAISQIPWLNDKDLNFVCSVFGMDKNKLLCFTRKQSQNQLWNS